MSARTTQAGPRVLLESGPDSASVNIATRLREGHSWSETEHVFDDQPILRLEEDHAQPVYLATCPDWHIRREGLGEDLAAALGGPLEAILVLSRHRAASGVPSFTAHPVGNPGPAADAGGRPRTPTPTHPHLLSAAYRALVEAAAPSDLPHTVSLEATHHGPTSAVPIVFIEIGSDDTHWGDARAGAVVAQAAYRSVTATFPEVPTIMGIGGGHYAPRFGDLLATTPASIGHMLASYHWAGDAEVPDEVLEGFLAASAPPGAARPSGVYFDRKSLPGPKRRGVLEALERLDIPILRTKDLVAASEAFP